jgi:hypothetical protein
MLEDKLYELLILLTDSKEDALIMRSDMEKLMPYMQEILTRLSHITRTRKMRGETIWGEDGYYCYPRVVNSFFDKKERYCFHTDKDDEVPKRCSKCPYR